MENIPFLIGLFIVGENLVSSGWTDILALQFSKILVLCIGYLSLISAGLMNKTP